MPAVIPFIRSHVQLRICVSSLHGAQDQDQWGSRELNVQSTGTSLIKTLTAPPVDTYLPTLVRHDLLKPEPQVQMGTKDTKIQAQSSTQLGSSFLATRRYDGYSRGPSAFPRPSLSRDSGLTRGEGWPTRSFVHGGIIHPLRLARLKIFFYFFPFRAYHLQWQ